ncbi:MAG: hypothetical protein ACK5M5_10855 [Limnobaculum xujianqingii]
MKTRYLSGSLMWVLLVGSAWSGEQITTAEKKESCLEVNGLWSVENQATLRDGWLLEIANANRCKRTGEMTSAMDAAMRALSIAKSTKDFSTDELDTSARLVARLLQEQNNFSQLSQFASQMVKEEGNKLSESDIKAWKIRAIHSASLAKNPDMVANLQQALFSDAKPYGKLWSLDLTHNQLHYDLASLNFPLISGNWVLAGFIPAAARGEAAEIIYVTGDTPEKSIELTFKVTYSEPDIMMSLDKTVKISPEQAHIDKWLNRLPVRRDLPLPPGKLPDFDFTQAKSANFMETKEVYQSGVKTLITHANWVVAKGDWVIEAQTHFNQQMQKESGDAVASLFSAITWPIAPNLYQTKMMSSQLFSVETKFNDYRDYSQVMKLADNALKDAVFPHELSELYAAMGMAQYHLNNRPEAKKLLHQAMVLDAFGGSSRNSLYSQAIQYMADIAWHEGRIAEGEKLNQRVLLSRPLSDKWAISSDSKDVVSQEYDIVLPVRLDDYYLEPAQKGRLNGSWFDYHNVNTRRKITLYILNAADFPAEKREKMFSYVFAEEGSARLDNATHSTITYADTSKAKEGTMWCFNAFPEFDETDEVVLSTAVSNDNLMVFYTRVHKDNQQEMKEVDTFMRKFIWKAPSELQKKGNNR